MKKSFSFGGNWRFYLKKYFNPEAIKEAEKSFLDFCGVDKIRNKTFLDIGCGSGLFSLAAFRLGANRVMSFDIDADSVKACRYLKKSIGSSQNWKVIRGSVLNKLFLKNLGKYDFVYSWGVLHHTGKMWEAIENAAKMVKENGYLYLAIYNRTDCWGLYSDGRFGPSVFWAKFKKWYFHLPSLLQGIIEYLIMASLFLVYFLTFKNPFKEISNHPKKYRGMSWRADIRDWLGGYPYEFATVDEVFRFLKKFGFILENLKYNGGLKNNEYLFNKVR